MTIDKAIEILTTWMETGEATSCSDLHTAERLAIEALKRLRETRAGLYAGTWQSLPGETER